jgi:spoIIIJ-associated protein
MEWVEMTGRSVAEAKDAALDELGVDEVDAEFEVLEEPRQGLFGRQRGEARVRARVRPTSPRPKTDRRDRKRRSKDGTNTRSTSDSSGASDGDDASRADSGAGGEAAQRGDGAESSGPRTPRRSGRRRGQAAGEGRTPQPAPAGRSGGRAAPGAQTGGDAGGSGARGGRADDDGGSGRLPGADSNGGTSVPEEELTLDEQGDIASTFVAGLLERFGFKAETSVTRVDDDIVEVQVSGDDLGVLIGPKGQTLQAVQELTRTVVQRRSVARTGRILVDISGYRSRRREALERFTHQVADDVRSSGVQRVLEPMNAADRKVVHDTATAIDGVHTVSEGEEPRRRVLIIPDGPAADAASAGVDATGPSGEADAAEATE